VELVNAGVAIATRDRHRASVGISAVAEVTIRDLEWKALPCAEHRREIAVAVDPEPERTSNEVPWIELDVAKQLVVAILEAQVHPPRADPDAAFDAEPPTRALATAEPNADDRPDQHVLKDVVGIGARRRDNQERDHDHSHSHSATYHAPMRTREGFHRLCHRPEIRYQRSIIIDYHPSSNESITAPPTPLRIRSKVFAAGTLLARFHPPEGPPAHPRAPPLPPARA